MFANASHRLDFADTRAALPDSLFALTSTLGLDAMDQMAAADAADRSLLRLVVCAAGATLLLALACSLAL